MISDRTLRGAHRSLKCLSCREGPPRLATRARRRLHTVPALTHGDKFRADGLADLFSKDGFDLAWTQYQGQMVEKLNQLTQGTPDENSTTHSLLTMYARQPDMASLFNHASMAHNNHFFFSGLALSKTNMSQRLAEDLESDFPSIETLRKEMIATACAMFGPGFVWLVKLSDTSQYRLLNTYIAGSPYAGAHYRRQTTDMNSQSQQSVGGVNARKYLKQQTVQNSVGVASNAKRLAPGGVNVIPILCLNTWEHVWLRDWGVGGKRWFCEAWWDKIDWDVVGSRAISTKFRGLGNV